MGIKALTDLSNESDNRVGQGASALADAHFTTSQQRVLALLFGQPDREIFVIETIWRILARDSVHESARRVSGSLEAGLYRDSPELATDCCAGDHTAGVIRLHFR